ncbi:hypothetical protein G7046_g1126 [Stylonectria norvegica]|nr:hypothetical protein G7046_g1126 [Stylonectria norvegica]
MGPGDDPYGHAEGVPHFEPERAGHTRTHRHEDQRRRQRRAMGDDDIDFEPQSTMGHFFVVSGILAATILAPLVYIQVMGARD